MIKYSFIVPVYNDKKHIERCINSIINQSFPGFELLLIDDGSTDGTAEICDRIKLRDNRVTVIHKPNGGLSDARNVGIENAKGEYIIFVDSDDYVNLDTCKNFEKYTNNNFDIIVGNTESGQVKQVNRIKRDSVMSGVDYLKKVQRGGYFRDPVWLNVYRRDFIVGKNLKFPVGYVHEDEYFTPIAFLNAGSVVYTTNNFYNYVSRKDSLTNNTNLESRKKRFFDSFEIAKMLEQIYLNIDDEGLKKVLLNRLAWSMFGKVNKEKAAQFTDISECKEFISRTSKSKFLDLMKRLMIR